MNDIPTIIQKQERLRAALQNQLYGTPMPLSYTNTSQQTIQIERPKRFRKAFIAIPLLALVIIGGSLVYTQQSTLQGVSIKTATPTATATKIPTNSLR
jgi:hypothetical protein